MPLLLLLACTPKEEAPAALSVTPGALDLGVVSEGESAIGTVELSNTGGGEIEILSASLVDGDSRAWTVERTGFAPLAGAVTTLLTITFSPREEGPSPAELQVRSTDPEHPSVYVELDGEGGPSTADTDGDGQSPADGDCDDADPAVYDGADEICDGADSDCDGDTPAEEADADGDSWRVCDEDCDDADGDVHPGAVEICDDKDSDCDGATPDRTDADGDGFSICDGDCDDAEADARPDGMEVCNGADDDCSGTADDLDADGDGATLCGAVPDCDDADPDAWPLYVDPAAADGGTGTEAAPFADLDDALDALDLRCRTVGLAAGLYADSVEWASGPLTLVGIGEHAADVVFTPAEGERAFTVTGGSLTLEDLTLAGGAPGDGDGGAITASGGDVTLIGVIASGNTSASDGGAVAVTSGVLTLSAGCSFSENTAGDDGGAVSVVSGTLRDDGSTWSGNSASLGGALLAVSSTVEMSDSTFEANTATGDGGAIALDGASSLAVERVRLVGNIAAGNGGAIALNDVTDPSGYLRNLEILGNSADMGGGVAFGGAEAALLFVNNTLVGNASDGSGAAVYAGATDASALYLWSNVFAWNDGGDGLRGGGGASVGWNLGYATDSGTDFTLDEADDAGENLVADPRFVDWSDDGDASNDDLSLETGSPARDSGPDGSVGPTYPWPDTDGSVNDRGATGGPGG